jgi:hypothetical protein
VGNLKRDEVDERRAFMRQLIADHPSYSARELNETFKKRYGNEMRNNMIYKIRREVQATAVAKPKRGYEPPKGFARRASTKLEAAYPVLVKFKPGDDQATAVEAAIAALREAGILNLRVQRGADGHWVLLQPA